MNERELVASRPRNAALETPWAAVALVVVGCFLGASADVALTFPDVGAAITFPPYAILAAALWRSPRRWWWMLLLASSAGNFVPHRHNGAPVSFVLLCELANYLRALITAAGLRTFAAGERPFDSLRGMVAYLVFGVVVAPSVAALAGATIVVGQGAAHPYWLVWQEWTLSNALTALTFLPLFVIDLDAGALVPRPGLTAWRAVEPTALFVGLFAVGGSVFFASYADPAVHPVLFYWPLPFLLWTAVRFGPLWTSAALLAISWLSILGALERRGPFVFHTPVNNLLHLQLFLIAVALPVLLLSSLLGEQRRTALALARAEDERRRLEAQKSVEAALRDADRRKDEFIALLGHELRNPLGSIAVSIEVLRRTSPATRQVTWAHGAITRQLQHVTRLVDDLLDISRITHGKIQLRIGRVDLKEVLQDAVQAARPTIDSFGHQLILDIPDGPARLDGDAVRLTQVVANLLNNAAKYTEPGGRIEVSIRRGLGGASLTVRDNGIGIAADFLETIFEPFAQIPMSRPAAAGGLGIGLTLVKRVVELHGGRVQAASAGVGGGSAFTISLPVVEADEPAAIAAAAPEQRPRAGRRVLIADDNVDQAEALRQLLELEDHAVEVVHDGAQALEASSRVDPDVMLVDISLPVVDGLEVARRVRERPGGRRPILVAVTGLGRPEDLRRSADAGFDHHLVKPIDLEMLERLLA